MKKHIVRNGKKIRGFVWQKKDGSFWYAFGRPSQEGYIAFSCRSLEHGISCVEMPMNLCGLN